MDKIGFVEEFIEGEGFHVEKFETKLEAAKFIQRYSSVIFQLRIVDKGEVRNEI